MIDVRFSRAPDAADDVVASDPRRDDATLSDHARLGGDEGLQPIVDDFLDRVFGDAMIGYLFDDKPKARIRTFELRWAAAHLGAAAPYNGRTLEVAHAPHRIFGGHFARRIQILRETLADHRVPADVAARWVAHDEGQRDKVVAGACR